MLETKSPNKPTLAYLFAPVTFTSITALRRERILLAFEKKFFHVQCGGPWLPVHLISTTWLQYWDVTILATKIQGLRCITGS